MDSLKPIEWSVWLVWYVVREDMSKGKLTGICD